jgi:hypothetical protein
MLIGAHAPQQACCFPLRGAIYAVRLRAQYVDRGADGAARFTQEYELLGRRLQLELGSSSEQPRR